jgi:predicted transcriptional regulator YdeE
MSRYHVYRSTHIHAAPERVFAVVADYGTWPSWSPWLCCEPDAEIQVSDNPSSVGSGYSWRGEIVGQGEIEHQQLQPDRLIEDEIRFIKPFRSRARVVFEIAPEGDGTKITWHMYGSVPWFLFWMRPQVEVFIGMDFERGLRMLKEWIETGSVLSQTKIRGVESVGPLQLAGVRKRCSFGDIGSAMDASFAEVMQSLVANGIPTDGFAMAVYHKMDLHSRHFDFTAGVSIPEGSQPGGHGLSSLSIPVTDALVVEHLGRYENLGNAWSAAFQHARAKKLKQSKLPPFEIYRNDPNRVSAADLRTDVYLPLR